MAGDVLRRGGTEEAEVGPDDVEPVRNGRGRPEPRDGPDDRRGGARLELEPGPEGGQPERLLVHVRGVARSAEAEMGRGPPRGGAGGHLAPFPPRPDDRGPPAGDG